MPNAHYYIQGQFTEAQDPNGEWVVKSPANLNEVLGKVRYSYKAVDDAAQSARQALPHWRNKSISERREWIKKYRSHLEKRLPELAKCLAREVGKPLWESELEIKQALAIIDFFLEEQSFSLVQNAQVTDPHTQLVGFKRFKPLGVVAVISPFNTPCKIANSHFIPALLAGNTVIHKPSEKATLFALMMTECIHESGLPAGVFNLVSGEKEVGRRLSVHEGVDAVFFAGSYDTGLRIKQETLQQYWKFLALEMGGKNPMIVCEDADFDLAVSEAVVGAFLSAGQRCSSTSRILVHQSKVDRFIEKFHERAKKFKIGNPLSNPFMGPLIDSVSVDRFLKFHAIISREGGEFVMRGKALETENPGYYVTPSICKFKECSPETMKKSVFHQTELFAPMVSVIPFTELEQGIALANASQYGLVASVFTQNHESLGRMCEVLDFGMVYWNKSTVGSSAYLPYGGFKKSGNHHPLGAMAAQHCVSALAVLEGKPDLGIVDFPGL